MEDSANFTPRVQHAIKIAKQQAIIFQQEKVEPLHLLYGVFKVQSDFFDHFASESFINNFNFDEYVGNLASPNLNFSPGNLTYSKTFKEVLMGSLDVARLYAHDYVGIEHVLVVLLNLPDLAFVYDDLNIEPNHFAERIHATLAGEAVDKAAEIKKINENKKKYKKLAKNKSDVRVNEMLSKYAVNFTELASQGKFDQVVCRNDSLQEIMEILCRRTKNNPIILGEAGVGKTAIVEALSQRIVAGEVSDFLLNKNIYSLNLSHIIAGTKYRGQFEERFKDIIDEIKNDENNILFIDEIHTIVGAGSAEGAMDAANILKPMLARGEIKCIGATTLKEYKQTIEKDAALERRFQSLVISEPSSEDCYTILCNIIPQYENFHNVKYRKNALKLAVELSQRYINDRFLPDKAIDIIDEAGSRVKINNFSKPIEIKNLEESLESLIEQEYNCSDNERRIGLNKMIDKLFDKYQPLLEKWQASQKQKKTYVSSDDIVDVISSKTKIPISILSSSSDEKYLKLKDNLNKEVIGQSTAIDSIYNSIIRSACGLNNPNKPLGTFLFLGKTGTGKTLTAKKIAKFIFGGERNLIRVDMGEYSTEISSSKLLGGSPGYVGYEEGSLFIDKVRNNPYSVVLFDEIEKAHPDVLKTLLTILDEGEVKDAFGRAAKFHNCLIILTGNLCSELMDKSHSGIGFASGNSDDILMEKVKEKVQSFFSPEFANRIEDLILFKDFSTNSYNKIINMQLNNLNKKLKSKKIKLTLCESMIDFLLKELKDINLGARPIERVFQKEIESNFAEGLLNKSITQNCKIVACKKEGKTFFKKILEKQN